jgi:2-polyprenyl-3-methyl-5-hydroxy-6-metoxy-1,4-benzoquinol methylase
MTTPPIDLLRLAADYLQCSACHLRQWTISDGGLRCHCGSALVWDGAILRAQTVSSDASTEFYDYTGGPRFVGTNFSDNVTIYASTRSYQLCLEEWLPQPTGALLDLGCGDGRLSLWALDKGFFPVVAVDGSAESLRRLVTTARDRDLKGLIPIAVPIQQAPLRPSSFQAILCIEVLYYLTASARRADTLCELASLLAPQGRMVLSEFTRIGRVLADVVAMNVENMRLTANHGERIEKFGDSSVQVSHPRPEELKRDCQSAGLELIASRGVSPIPMLFQHAYTFTSYPLRPSLDAAMKNVIDTLDDMSSDASSLSRNLVLLLRRHCDAL